MDAAWPSLLFATATVGASAAALSAFQMTQRTYLGFAWWSGALWLNAGTAALVTLLDGAARWTALAQLLFIPWPLLCVLGLRRFHARTVLPASARSDMALLAALMCVSVLATLATPETALTARTAPMAAAAALLYAAWVAWRAPLERDLLSVRVLSVLWVMVALLPLLVLASMPDPRAAAAIQTGIVALGSLVAAFVLLALSSQRTEREMRDSRRKLRVLANIDMLTQVPNRRRFEELARRALQTDAPGSATLLLVDIDHFKQINDQLGHAAGDRALKLVSRCTLDLLRSQDVAGRHGGDEFVLLLRRSSTQDAMRVAERLVAHLQTQAHAHALPRLTLSFGIVQMRGGESIDDTLQRADLALYEAKRLGRSRAVAAYGDEDDQPAFRSSERLGLSAN
jgi:diguanylate cyclase